MGTVFLHTLWESLHRRMGLVLLAISVLVPTGLLYLIRFQARDDGTVMAYLFSNRVGTAAEFVPSALSGLLQMTVGLWLFMGIFAIAPLLTTYLEKGWADLLLSKGVARWQVLLGRYGGGLALFATTLLILDGAPAIYFWARTGIAPGRFFLGVAMLGLSFASVLALMALTAMVQASPSILIIVGFMQVIVSSLLAQRESLYALMSAQWVQWLMDWVYRILPKNHELLGLAVNYLRTGTIESWWAVWSSALFVAGALGLSAWLLHRKSF